MQPINKIEKTLRRSKGTLTLPLLIGETYVTNSNEKSSLFSPNNRGLYNELLLSNQQRQAMFLDR
jgi:hypothetical protein